MSRIGKNPVAVPEGRRSDARPRRDLGQGPARHADAAPVDRDVAVEKDGEQLVFKALGNDSIAGQRDVRHDARAGRQHGAAA